MTALPLLTWRFVFAALVAWLLLLATASGRRSLRSIGRRRLVILLGLGALYVGNAGSFTAALATVPVPLVSIIAFLYPALVAVLSVRFVRRLEGRRAWVALGVSTLGIALAVGRHPVGRRCAHRGAVARLHLPHRVRRLDRARRRALAANDRHPSVTDEELHHHAHGRRERAGWTGHHPVGGHHDHSHCHGPAILAVLAGDSIAPADVPAGAWLALIGFGTFSALAFRWFLAARVASARRARPS